MKGILISTNYTMEEIDIENSLEALQKAVDGYIEVVTLVPGHAEMLVNEEGLLREMPRNAIASIITNRDIVGPALIVGASGEEFCDVPDDIKRFIRVRYGGGIIR